MSSIGQNDIAKQGNFDKLIGNLSIFSDLPKFDRNKNDVSSSQKNTVNNNHILDLQRPLTPLDKQIRNIPNSLDDLVELFRRQIPSFDSKDINEELKIYLLGTIEHELGLIWLDLKGILDYPLVDEKENKEIRRKITIVIIRRCVDLYNKYIDKMKLYRENNVFGEEANFVRIKLQLAEDFRSNIHIPTLRRHVYMNEKDVLVDDTTCCEKGGPLEIPQHRYNMAVNDRDKRSQFVQEIEGFHGNIQGNQQTQQSTIPTDEIEEDEIVKDESQISDEEDKDLDNTDQIYQDIRRNNEDLVELTKYEELNEDETEQESKEVPESVTKTSKSMKLQDKLEKLKAENDRKDKEDRMMIPAPIYPQPSTIPRRFGDTVYMIADIRPTPRKSSINISLDQHGPLWNELADEIYPETVKYLEQNLHRLEEVKDIYNELMATVSRDHMKYTEDPIFEKCPEAIKFNHIVNSHTIENYVDKTDRVVNSNLNIDHQAPWKQSKLSREEWQQPDYNSTEDASSIDLMNYINISKVIREESNRNLVMRGSMGSYGSGTANQSARTDNEPIKRDKRPGCNYLMDPQEFEAGLYKLPKLMQDKLNKVYRDWIKAWKEKYESDDFFKYTSLQPSDYMSVIYHYFDDNDASKSGTNRDEEDLDPEVREQKKKMQERDQERINIVQSYMDNLVSEKSQFSKGSWNSSSIKIGGLGKPPELSDETISKLLQEKPSLTVEAANAKKPKATYSRAKSATSNDKPTPLFYNEEAVEDPLNKTMQEMSHLYRMTGVQSRLENIWCQLKMPAHLRLDMAIKYSAPVQNNKPDVALETVLKQWENGANRIVQREVILEELETFERIASDPNRFFAKGFMGSSTARLEESELRKEIINKLDDVTIKVQENFETLKSVYNDILTYEGRPYDEKMKWDKIEMLYWLQEERKQQTTNKNKLVTLLKQIHLNPVIPDNN